MNKKKILIIVACVVAAICLIVGVTFLLNDATHEHTYTNSCDSTCNKCGESRNAVHSYDHDCDAFCNICAEERTVGGHQYDNEYDDTCNICGYKRTVNHVHSYDNVCDPDCNECGAIRVAQPHIFNGDCDRDCNVCYYVRDAGEHSYSFECDNTCDVCGFTRQTTHTYTHVCDTSCEVCGEYRTAEHLFETPCDELCKLCGFKRSVEHSYFNACDAICDFCGYERDIPGHQYDNDEDTTCNNCGAYRGENHKHTYKYPCSNKCENCNGERVPEEPHKYDNAMDMECNYCGESRLDSHEHVYDNTCDETCNVCNAERTIYHTYDNADDAICNICNYQRILDHDCVYATPCHKLCTICWKETGEGHRFVNKVCAKCGAYDKCDDNACVFDNECDEICDVCGYRRGWAEHDFVNGYCTKCGTPGYESHMHEYDSMCDDTCNVCGLVRVAHGFISDCDERCNFCEYVREGKTDHVDTNNDKLCDNCGEIMPISSDVDAKINTFIGLFNKYLTNIEQGATIANFENKAFTNVSITGNLMTMPDGYYKSFEMYDNMIVYKYNDYNVYKTFGKSSYVITNFNETEITDSYIYFNYTVKLPKITIYDLSYDVNTNTVSIKNSYLFNLFTTLEDSNWDPNIVIGNVLNVNFENIRLLVASADSATCNIKLDNNGNIAWYRFELIDNNSSILLNEYSVDGNNIEIKFNKNNYVGRMTSTLTIKNSKLTYVLNEIVDGTTKNATITANVTSVSKTSIPAEIFDIIDGNELLVKELAADIEKYQKLYEVDAECENIYVKANFGNFNYLFARDKNGQYYLSQLITEFELQEFMCEGKVVNGALIVTKHNHE